MVSSSTSIFESPVTRIFKAWRMSCSVAVNITAANINIAYKNLHILWVCVRMRVWEWEWVRVCESEEEVKKSLPRVLCERYRQGRHSGSLYFCRQYMRRRRWWTPIANPGGSRGWRRWLRGRGSCRMQSIWQKTKTRSRRRPHEWWRLFGNSSHLWRVPGVLHLQSLTIHCHATTALHEEWVS